MIDSSHFRLSLWSQKSQFDWHDSKIPLCLISNATVIVYVTVRKDVYSAYFSVLRLSFCSPLLWSATAFPVFVCLFCVYLFVKPRPGFGYYQVEAYWTAPLSLVPLEIFFKVPIYQS